MTSQALNALNPENRRDAYFEIAERIEVPALACPEPALVPWGNPFEPWLLHELAAMIIRGGISTLDELTFCIGLR